MRFIEPGGFQGLLPRQDELGVLLLGGRGTRVADYTGGTNKHLTMVQGLTLAERSVQFLLRSGISRISVVCSPQDRAAFCSILQQRFSAADLLFVTQEEPLGTAHAMQSALRDEHPEVVTLTFGDNMFSLPQNLEWTSEGDAIRIFIAEADEPRHFGVVHIDGGSIVDIACKPTAPRASTVCVGLMQFTRSGLQLCDGITPNVNGELDVMDAVIHAWHQSQLPWRAVAGDWADVATNTATLTRATATL